MEKMETDQRIITTVPGHGHQNRLIYALTMLLIAKIIIFWLLGIRQGVTGSNTCNWPIAFPSKCLMASAELTPNNENDDLWNADLFMYFTCTTVRRGGEGRNLYHIGVGV